MSGVALVTGAAGDIGSATARRLAADGFHVIAADLDGERAAALAGEVRACGGSAESAVIDVASLDSVAGVLEAVGDRHAGLDVLVNGAGVVRIEPFEECSREDFLRIYEINVLGAYTCLQQALPLLRRREGRASVVNIASVAGKRPGPLIAAYSCAKAAVISLTRSAAAALGPAIRVNCVCPGVVAGRMWEAIDERLDALGAPASSRFAERVGAQPLPRPADPAEVADVIAFLASPASRYVTGEDVNVDGGQLMH